MSKKAKKKYINGHEVVPWRKGISLVYLGRDEDGEAIWGLPIREKVTRRFGAADAGLQDMKRAGIPVQDRITKKLPGGLKLEPRNKKAPRNKGWTLDSRLS